MLIRFWTENIRIPDELWEQTLECHLSPDVHLKTYPKVCSFAVKSRSIYLHKYIYQQIMTNKKSNKDAIASWEEIDLWELTLHNKLEILSYVHV